LHIIKDKEELYEQLKYLCMHIRPEAFEDEIRRGDLSESTQFVVDLERNLGRKLTQEEMSKLSVSEEVDIDIIEPITNG